jgi:hypothetical protein
MPMQTPSGRTLVNEVILGAGLGLLILGGGGRAVMRGIALVTDAPSVVSVGGTVTVLAAGAAAGAAGALLHALSRLAAAWGAGGRVSVRLALFAALLALVTARGLHGSPLGPATAFWPLVLVYAVSFVQALGRRARQGASGPSAPAIAPAA